MSCFACNRSISYIRFTCYVLITEINELFNEIKMFWVLPIWDQLRQKCSFFRWEFDSVRFGYKTSSLCSHQREKGRKMCETTQYELSDGCKCFQQLLLQRVHHTQSIPKQIKSKWEDRMRKAAVDWMTIMRTNEHQSSSQFWENILKYSWFYKI